MKDKKIGFIGQGWIGKNYADDFERRGYNVIRYSIEEPHIKNGDKIGDCDIVFIAVPTPTTPKGFDDSILADTVKLVGQGKIAIIKSTLLPGTTEKIQKENQGVFVMHSPEFLQENTVIYDAANPKRNIIGIPFESDEYRKKAKEVMGVLPYAPYTLVCASMEAELIKYGGNNLLYFKVIFINLLYDVSAEMGCDWEVVKSAMSADPRLGATHLDPKHKSGRGAGGRCFIKDFTAFAKFYKELVGDEAGINALKAIEKKNIDLLVASDKDLDLLKGVYGDDVVKKQK